MKLLKISSLKMLVSLSFLIVFLSNSCTQSSKSNDNNIEGAQMAIEQVDKPKIDIHTAVMQNNLDAVLQHIKAGTDINAKEQMSGSTPLISAATFGKTSIAKVLIDAKADLNITNNDGATALHTASFFCRLEIVQLLIDAKADKTIKNNFGATARESVMGPFADMKPIYKMIQQQLSPLGLQLDLDKLENDRPVVAIMLQ